MWRVLWRASAVAAGLAGVLTMGCGSGSTDPSGPSAPTRPEPTIAPPQPPEPTASATPAPTAPTESAFFLSIPAAATGRPPGAGILLRSLDGETWKTVLPFRATPTFLNSLEGWAATHGALFRTVDGGTTWFSSPNDGVLRGKDLGQIDFADRARGVMVASVPGVPEHTFTYSISLLRTDDGGQSWSTTLERDGCTSGGFVCLTDAGDAVALICGTAVFRSSDAGATWSDVSDEVPLSSEFGEKTLACARKGSDFWIVDHGPAWHSGDGGRTWEEQDLPRVPDFDVTDVAFEDREHGWAVGLFRGPPAGTAVYRTEDAGRSWTRQFAPLRDSAGFLPRIESSGAHAMVSTSTFFSTGFGPPRTVGAQWTTADGGENWLRRDTEPFSGFAGFAAAPAYATAVAEPPTEPIPGPLPPLVSDEPLSFLTAQNAGVFRTTDNGLTWSQSLHMPTLQQLYGVDLVDRLTGYVVGDSGAILKTTDGGTTWSTQGGNELLSFLRVSRLWTVAFADHDHGIIGGQLRPTEANVSTGLVLLYTKDGGANWEQAAIAGIENNFGAFPQSLCMLKNGLALAAGHYSVRYASAGGLEGIRIRHVLISDDFGANWIDVEAEIGAPENFFIREVACTEESDLWLFGGLQDESSLPAIPYALHSPDGGITWNEIPMPLPAEMVQGRSPSGAAFVDSRDGWVTAGPLGDHLAVLSTEDGGATWAPLLVSEEPLFSNALVERLDQNRAIVAATEQVAPLRQKPRVLVTDDRGRSWTSVEFPTTRASRPLLDLATAP